MLNQNKKKLLKNTKKKTNWITMQSSDMKNVLIELENDFEDFYN